MRYVFNLVSILLCVQMSAEMYKGITPLDTLADVKARFPNATFEQLKPAWAQQVDVMYRITGSGLSGRIIVKFYDARPDRRSDAATAEDEEQRKFMLEMANAPDESINVEWVRWVPDEPIPLQRFVSKYGVPEARGFDDDDLQPFRAWKLRGLVAYLSDDEKLVVQVNYFFTDEDRCASWLGKYGSIPKFMKEACRSQERRKPAAQKPPKK